MVRRGLGVSLMVAAAVSLSACGLSPGDVAGSYELTSGIRVLFDEVSGERREAYAAGSIREFVPASRYEILYVDGLFVLGDTVPEESCDLSAFISGNEAFLAAGSVCTETFPSGRQVTLQIIEGEMVFSQNLAQAGAAGNFFEIPAGSTQVERTGFFETIVNLTRID